MDEENTMALTAREPLELIPLENLPKGAGQELAVRKQNRLELLKTALCKSSFSILSGVLSVAYGWATIGVWWYHFPLIIALPVTLIFLALAAAAGVAARYVVLDVLAFRKTAISPQLEERAGEEKALAKVVGRRNQQIASCNLSENMAAQHDPGERFLRRHEANRQFLSAESDKFREFIKRTNRK